MAAGLRNVGVALEEARAEAVIARTQARVAALKSEKGAAFTICDVEIPTRIR